MEHYSDKELVRIILKGNQSAYADLIDRHKVFVFNLSLRMLKQRELAEEVAQDVFIKVYRKLNTYKGDSKFSSWLYSIAYRTCLDQIKKEKRHLGVQTLEEKHYELSSDVQDALGLMQEEERVRILKEHVEALSSREAALIQMYYFEEMSVSEVAEIMNLKKNNVKIILHRARKALHDQLLQDPRMVHLEK